MEEKQKIVVIVGPTASGKTSCAIDLATHFNGEVISADSRQVYRGLDIGTEKATPKEMRDIPHYLIDIVDPHNTYTAADFKKDAERAIADIATRGKLPIIAGGTFFYVETLLGTQTLPDVPPNETLRATLEKKTDVELLALIAKRDPIRAENIDPHNRRRLMRALEIIEAKGVVPAPAITDSPYDALIIGIDVPKEILRERIETRLDETLAKGLVEETNTLLKNGVPRKRLDEIGLEYRVVLEYLDGEISEETMREKLVAKVWQYAKRQLTYLKKMENIAWYTRDDVEKMNKDVAAFLN